jgi:hypothetical protein
MSLFLKGFSMYFADIFADEIRVGDIIEFRYYGGSQYSRNRMAWVTFVDDKRICGYDLEKVAEDSHGCRNYTKNLIGYPDKYKNFGKPPAIKLIADHIFKQGLELRRLAPELRTNTDVVFTTLRDMLVGITPYEIIVTFRNTKLGYFFNCIDGVITVEPYQKNK